MKKTKRSKRKQTKYPALQPELNLKIRYDEIADMASYANSLSEEDKAWLNKFSDEYVNCNLDRKNLKKNLHKTKKLKKSNDKRNNDRNADILSRAKAMGALSDYEEVDGSSHERVDEDYVIDIIDNKKKKLLKK